MMDATTRRVLASHAFAATAVSLPWPLLLVMVWQQTQSESLLGAAAAARMAPYVLLSWWVPRLADRHRRDLVVRATLVARLVGLVGVTMAVAADRAVTGVVIAALVVAVSTPAYPTLAAGMPRLAGSATTRRATELLVTIEVASFVVGPAIGGLLLGLPWLVTPAAVALAGLGWLCYAGVSQPRPVATGSTGHPSGWDLRPLRTALTALVVVNLVLAAAGVALLPLAESQWPDGPGATAYGVATGALGFGALAAPLLRWAGVTARAAMGWGLVLLAGALAVTAGAPSVVLAVLPLLLAGAAAVRIEAAATTLLQEAVPDDHRAGVLGLGDTAMVSAAMVGALVAPLVAAGLGPEATLVVLAVGCLTLMAHLVSGPGRSAWRRAQATTWPRRITRTGRRSTDRSTSGSLL